jgi:hypothetical protein
VTSLFGSRHAEIAHHRQRRPLLRARRERPRCCRATEQGDELAPSKPIEWHPLPPSQGGSIADWQGSVRVLLHCGTSIQPHVGSGSILLKKDFEEDPRVILIQDKHPTSKVDSEIPSLGFD